MLVKVAANASVKSKLTDVGVGVAVGVGEGDGVGEVVGLGVGLGEESSSPPQDASRSAPHRAAPQRKELLAITGPTF